MQKVLVTGSSGMVGSIVLELCLNNPEIEEVISLVRRPSGLDHPKLIEIERKDFNNYDDIEEQLSNIDVLFFCIGVYTGAVPRNEFYQITVDHPIELARAVKRQTSNFRFCLLSGAGADRTEKSRMMFAKDKGIAENRLDSMELGEFYTFRPAYIYPVTPRNEPSFMYRLSRMLYKPLFSKLGPNASIKSTELAEAMVKVGLEGYKTNILENAMIKKLVDS